MKHCEKCGKVFASERKAGSGKRSDARFCSRSCKEQARHVRRASIYAERRTARTN